MSASAASPPWTRAGRYAALLALTLFRLAPGRSVEEYRAYSRTRLREQMLTLPSVLGFRDLEISGLMAGEPQGWDLVEVIEIAGPAAFEADHRDGPGKATAEEWSTWVSSHCVLYCHDL